MATNDEIPAVSDIENAKKSDGTSTAGEHNVKEQSDEVKKDNTKCDINEIKNDEEKTTNGSKEEDNKKIKKIESSIDETNPEVPNQELIIV